MRRPKPLRDEAGEVLELLVPRAGYEMTIADLREEDYTILVRMGDKATG
jgi:hypothetical protein